MTESDDMTYQRRNWRVQRIGWAVMAALLLLALAGGLGGGPLSEARTGTGPVRVRYHRIVRLDAPTPWEVTVVPDRRGRLAFAIDRAAFTRLELERMSPPASRTEVTSDGQLFLFDSSAGAAITVRMSWIPRRIGRARATLRHEAEALPLSQLVLP